MENKLKTIYSDFDGTITKSDAVNTFFELYADKKWLEYEQQWIDGKISSRENAIKQVALLPEVTEKQLNDYIESIEITDGFVDFYNEMVNQRIKMVILSDGFDLFINKTLEKHGIKNVEIYANHLIYKNNKFSIEFPYFNNDCKKKSGMCKCQKIKEHDYLYIGDGTSDLCVARGAKILFATKNLNNYCNKYNLSHIPFKDFYDILEHIKGIIL